LAQGSQESRLSKFFFLAGCAIVVVQTASGDCLQKLPNVNSRAFNLSTDHAKPRTDEQ